MNKINFTEKNSERLANLAVGLLFSGEIFKGLLGTEHTVYDLVHNTSINSFKKLEEKLRKELADAGTEDIWDIDPNKKDALIKLEAQVEFVTVLRGYKIYQSQQHSIEMKKALLEREIQKVEEISKTPEQKIAELKAQLAMLEG